MGAPRLRGGTMTDRTNERLDTAIITYRENPTDANRRHLLTLQREHVDAFYREQAREFMARTHR